MINSKNKGKSFELKIAHIFQDWGYKARRTQQFSGANGDADIEGVPYLSIECKARETWNVYDWMEQAVKDSQRNGRIPTVIAKKNNHEILVIQRLDDFLSIYREYEVNRTQLNKEKEM